MAAFANAVCCSLFKFCNWIVAYLLASSIAIGNALSAIAFTIAADATLDEPRPLAIIMSFTFLTFLDAQAGSGLPSSSDSYNAPT